MRSYHKENDMKSITGSKTERNLLAAFAGESQARNRYAYFSGKARDEGYMQISAIFTETAEQEREHAKRFFSLLEGGDVEVTAAFPAGKVGTTEENLAAAAAGEQHEWSTMYPEFARIAREEGFEMAAKAFEAVAVAEKQHERRYNALLANVKQGRVFKREKATLWRCLNCGYIFEGEDAPKVCPACLHPQSYFEPLAENW